ncbi:hypothetical protein CO2235_190095 [Cupriavidus oxalaticus]|uniref:Uncharacterized protein n=1 Tax=Cupriavidus oxalaticus TaxID=96344 RepID=A0A375G200_9BURK|nr:hypothetical protein CO2235_190095 [Cupriavidus oxalaticus]
MSANRVMVRVSPSGMALKRRLAGLQSQSGGGLAGEAADSAALSPGQHAHPYGSFRGGAGLKAL